jgi:acetyltransferase
MDIRRFDIQQVLLHLDALTGLLQDAVDHGASIGFYPPPLAVADARCYWQGIGADLAAGPRILLAALAGAQVVGCVQVQPETRSNGSHRGEVQKLMVHTAHRQQGWGRALMQAAEDAARAAGLKLLVLDVAQGAPAEKLYQRSGWQFAGFIPDYARSADGSLHATAYYYRQLGE